jgi:hypothetical protein
MTGMISFSSENLLQAQDDGKQSDMVAQAGDVE